MNTDIEIRRAAAHDQDDIVALVRSDRLNPTGLRWQRFVVAQQAGRLVGAVQLRQHADGAHELRLSRGDGAAARPIPPSLFFGIRP